MAVPDTLRSREKVTKTSHYNIICFSLEKTRKKLLYFKKESKPKLLPFQNWQRFTSLKSRLKSKKNVQGNPKIFRNNAKEEKQKQKEACEEQYCVRQ